MGTVLEGKYELVRKLGAGGMGEVYEGRHRVIGRRVAVKFLLPEYARRQEIVDRFENEARAAGGVEHENVGAVFDVGALPDETRYLVMEFLDGGDVEKLLAREGPLPLPRAAFILIQACRGLDVVHQRGIVHRDLKPANLFLTKRADKTDLVKVLDFGIAKLRTGGASSGATRTGAAIGTAYYMSPEQARGERDVDARSDIYSLGVILYELLSGRKPHDGDSLLQILHRVMTQSPVPLEQVRSGLPAGVYSVVRKAMAPSPADRFQTVADLGDALLPFAGRALAPIRSHPAGFADAASRGAETRASSPSMLGAPPTVTPVVTGGGTHVSQPKMVRASIPGERRSRKGVLIGIGAMVLSGVAAVAMVAARKGPMASGAQEPATTIGATAVLAATPAVSTLVPAALPSPTVVAPVSSPTGVGPVSAGSDTAQSFGHRKPSGHSRPAQGAAVPQPAPEPRGPASAISPPAVAPLPNKPSAPAAPKPTNRGDNPF